LPQHGLRCWRFVAQCGVRPFGVVVPPPALDDDFGLGQAVEDFAIEQFVAELGVEALTVSFVGITLHWSALLPSKVPR